MRQDARTLLERLGSNEFRYQEFEDAFADMELWPIFEALLTDRNVVGHQASVLRSAEVQINSIQSQASQSQPDQFEPAQSAAASPSLLSRYANSVPHAATAPVSAVNLRQFFDRFAEEK